MGFVDGVNVGVVVGSGVGGSSVGREYWQAHCVSNPQPLWSNHVPSMKIKADISLSVFVNTGRLVCHLVNVLVQPTSHCQTFDKVRSVYPIRIVGPMVPYGITVFTLEAMNEFWLLFSIQSIWPPMLLQMALQSPSATSPVLNT